MSISLLFNIITLVTMPTRNILFAEIEKYCHSKARFYSFDGDIICYLGLENVLLGFHVKAYPSDIEGCQLYIWNLEEKTLEKRFKHF